MAVSRAVPARGALLVACGFAAASAALLLLPWWTAPAPVLLTGTGPAAAATPDRWSGWDLAGPVVGALLGALVVAAVVLLALRRTTPARALVVAAGATAVAVGALALVSWGTSGPAVATIACGVAAAGLAALAVPAVLGAALLAAVVPVLPHGPGPVDRPTAGPFVRLAPLDAPGLRSGSAALPAAAATAVVVEGRPGLVTADGLAVLDAAGRFEVRARTPEGPPDRPAIIGVAGGRVVRWSAADTVTVTGLDPSDPVAVTVHGVGGVSRLGANGALWVRATSDPPDAARYLDLAQRNGTQTADATYLPVVAIHGPVAAAPVDVTTVVPVGRSAVRATAQEAGTRLERLSGSPTGGIDVTPLAGGLDPACGLTGSGPQSFLSRLGALAPDAGGGIWFVTGADPDPRLVRLGPDGRLRAVAAPLPGPVSSLAVAPDGAVVLVLRDAAGPGLWLLPDAAAALTDLPAAPPGCTPAPAPVAPPVTLVPVGRADHDRLGVPLGADGRWASAGRGGTVSVVSPSGSRTPVGVRSDGGAGRVWPDGSGGVWWLEANTNGVPDTLVHGTAGGEQRYPPVPNPAPQEGPALIPDLGGRPPLLATAAGAYRIDAGSAVAVVPGRIGSGVVRTDGRGWVLADGALLALDAGRALGPVIDAGDRRADTTPVSVQLAKGVTPARLALPRATVALDPTGRAVVVADDVVLAVGDDGSVSVVAQDRRLVGPALFATEGGIVASDRGDLLRVDLPR